MWLDGLDLTQIMLSGSSLPGTNSDPDGILWCPFLSQKNKDNSNQFVRIFLYFYPFQKMKVWSNPCSHLIERKPPKSKAKKVCVLGGSCLFINLPFLSIFNIFAPVIF